MRLPRLRLSLRQMMALVAASGVLLGAGVWALKMRELRDHYRREVLLCSIHARIEISLIKMESSDFELRRSYERLSALAFKYRRPGGAELLSPPGDDEAEADLREKARRLRIDHWLRLTEKYRSAAARPWTAVAPDPPEPPLPPRRVKADPPPEEAAQELPRPGASRRRRVYD